MHAYRCDCAGRVGTGDLGLGGDAVEQVNDPATDAAIAALWPAAWAKANDPTRPKRGKARGKLRARYRLHLAFGEFKRANPTASCGNCAHFERMPNDSKGRMHCAAESDFYGYQIAVAGGLCMKWEPAA